MVSFGLLTHKKFPCSRISYKILSYNMYLWKGLILPRGYHYKEYCEMDPDKSSTNISNIWISLFSSNLIMVYLKISFYGRNEILTSQLHKIMTSFLRHTNYGTYCIDVNKYNWNKKWKCLCSVKSLYMCLCVYLSPEHWI